MLTYAASMWRAKRPESNNIVTNPPYNCAEGFVASDIKHARHKFALLLRLAFLEGANRANTIFTRVPPSRGWVFSERITFYPKGAVMKVLVLPRMLGSYGRKMRPAEPNSSGSSRATGHVMPPEHLPVVFRLL